MSLEQSEQWKAMYVGSDVRKRLLEIAHTNYEILDRPTYDYDMAGWPYLMADFNGQRRAWLDIIQLLTVRED